MRMTEQRFQTHGDHRFAACIATQSLDHRVGHWRIKGKAATLIKASQVRVTEQPYRQFAILHRRGDQRGAYALFATRRIDEQPGQPMPAGYRAQTQRANDVIAPGHPQLRFANRFH